MFSRMCASLGFQAAGLLAPSGAGSARRRKKGAVGERIDAINASCCSSTHEPDERVPAVKLSIVIPVYNEERHVLDVLRRVAAVALDKELVVVNDASRDGTRRLLEEVERDPARVLSSAQGRTELRIYHQPVNR